MNAQTTTQYLSFFIGEEEYGLGILESREIIQYPSVTKVPSMPACIRGVINLRGSVVPVLDLAVLFGFSERPITKWTCVVVVESGKESGSGELVGIVVDSVSQVIDLGEGDIEAAPSFGTQVKQRFLRGMGKSGKSFVLLLDLGQVLSEVRLDAVGSSAGEAGVESVSEGSAGEEAEAASP